MMPNQLLTACSTKRHCEWSGLRPPTGDVRSLISIQHDIVLKHSLICMMIVAPPLSDKGPPGRGESADFHAGIPRMSWQGE